MQIIGITDEQTTCDRCGRVELRSTVILGDAERTEIGRYGSHCAGKVLSEATGRRVTGVLDTARTVEAVRRQYVTEYLGRAVKFAKAGDWARANHLRAEGRRDHGYLRPDEIALNDKILAKVLQNHRTGGATWE